MKPMDTAYDGLREKVKGRNINEQTLLATDYLNHFNEVIMLIEMVPDMPECLEDVQDWQPKSYPDHFRDSSFSDKDLAIEAYEHAPERYREPFDATVDKANRLVRVTIERLEKAIEHEDPDALPHITAAACAALKTLLDQASAIIHGSETTMDQSEIDGLLSD
ncbi:MAG: hypothetical protein ACPGO3_15130 [Magnetospiraceae bacterium]